jgi:hypothetical protein
VLQFCEIGPNAAAKVTARCRSFVTYCSALSAVTRLAGHLHCAAAPRQIFGLWLLAALLGCSRASGLGLRAGRSGDEKQNSDDGQCQRLHVKCSRKSKNNALEPMQVIVGCKDAC